MQQPLSTGIRGWSVCGASSACAGHSELLHCLRKVLEGSDPGPCCQTAAIALGACCTQIGAAAVDAATQSGMEAAEEMSAAAACVADRPRTGLPVVVLLLNRLAWSMNLVASGRSRGGRARGSAASCVGGSDSDAEDGAPGGCSRRDTAAAATADVRRPGLPAPAS